MLKWSELLKTKSNITERINKIPIKTVLDRLKIEYKWNKLWDENWIETDGWRINVEGNYIHSFTHDKERAEWEPFAFALKYFKNKYGDDKCYVYTYSFFAKNFWIVWQQKQKELIRINKFLLENLLNHTFSQIEFKYFLYVLKYIFDKWVQYEKIDIRLVDFLKHFTIKSNLNYVLKIFNNISSKNILKITSYDKKYVDSDDFQAFKMKLYKFKNENDYKEWWYISFQLLPEKETSLFNVYNRKIENFVSTGLLKLTPKKDKLIDLCVYIQIHLFNSKTKELKLTNYELNEFLFNQDYYKRKYCLEKIQAVMGNFEVEYDKGVGVWKFIRK